MSTSQQEKLNSLPTCGPYRFDGAEQSERIVYLYVDYGLLSSNGNEIWGNWNRTTSGACSELSRSYVRREDMRNYEFVLRCDHHSRDDDGIYKFSIAIGGS